MVATATTIAFEGIDVTEVEVQVQLASGMPAFTLVGLPDKAVGESRERVRAALNALGLALPAKRITINLAPADLTKEGSHFDLPIALGLLVAMGVIPQDEISSYMALGELSLDGRLLPVAGALPAAMGASARDKGLICPQANGPEAAWAGDIPILAAPSLLGLINHFKGTQRLIPPACETIDDRFTGPDLTYVKGQQSARRALEIAAAGGHNLLMIGPPGTGKSMLASCLPGILPPLDAREMLEVSMIHSIAGKLTGGQLRRTRPFRDPHHSSSLAAMVGGGKRAVPGEISLAHQGVLFLDEFPEFPRALLESLRQPMEAGKVSIARANAHYTYPANFQLVAAMNPCRCGYLTDAARACGKAPRCAVEYQSKISGPLLDRIDIHIDVPAVETLSMLAAEPGESTEAVAARVKAAREIQKRRFASMAGHFRTNADLAGEHLTASTRLDDAGRTLLEQATDKMRLSMRGYTRILRVARTIADLEQSESVKKMHIGEAITYRQMQLSRAIEAV